MSYSVQEHAFDALAIPEPVDDGGMFDEGGVDADYDDDPCDVSERALGHVGNNNILFITKLRKQLS